MITQKEIDELWYSYKIVPGVKFRLNDSVRIKEGFLKKENAVVISLLEIELIPKYSIELGITGEIIEEYETNLELTDEAI